MTYEEELRQHYSQVKKRLYNSVIKKIAAHEPDTEHEPKTDPVKKFADEANIYRPQWQVIIDEVCEKHGIAKNDMMSKSMKNKIVFARFEAIYRMRNEVDIGGKQMSLIRIKKIFGIDHKTVVNAIKRHEEVNK